MDKGSRGHPQTNDTVEDVVDFEENSQPSIQQFPTHDEKCIIYSRDESEVSTLSPENLGKMDKGSRGHPETNDTVEDVVDSEDNSQPSIQQFPTYDANRIIYSRDESEVSTLSSENLGNLGDLLSRVQSQLPGGVGRSIITLANQINVLPPSTQVTAQSSYEIPGILKEKMEKAKLIFEATRGYDHVLGALEDEGHVVIAGSPGSGKTTMSLCIMHKYWKKKKYKLNFVKKIRNFEFAKEIDMKHPTLLVFDDVFGYFSLRQDVMLDYKSVFEDIDEHFKKQSLIRDTHFPLKVVFCSRTDILKHASLCTRKFHSLFKPSSVVNLTTLAKLNIEEKKRILNKHLTKCNINLEDGDIDVIVNQEYGTLGFPYICELFRANKKYHKSAVDFFRKPLEYLHGYVLEIFEIDDFKNTAALMLLLVLSDGKLDLAKVADVTQYKDGEINVLYRKLKPIIPGLERDNFLSMMKKQASNQLQTYLTSEGDIVKFSHPTIHDTVAYVVGCKDPIFVLRHCNLTFIIERVKVAEKSVDQLSSGDDYDFTINLQKQSLPVLVQRLSQEVTNGNFALSLSHLCLREENIAEMFYVKMSSDENFKQTIHTTEAKYHRCFLFWISFTCNNALCRSLQKHEDFSEQEILEALLGNCMSGNLQGLQIIFEHCQSNEHLIKKVKFNSLREILHEEEDTRHTYHNIAAAHDNSSKDDVVINGPRMHGEQRDQLIHIAAANGHIDIVIALLEFEVDIDSRGGTGMTPLMYACYLGYKELAETLIKRRADLTLLDEEDDNCLHLASRAGFTNMVELLLKSGTEINSRGYHERTSLMFASQHGKLDVVKLLLQRGGEVELDLSEVSNKDNCLHLATMNGNMVIVEVLIEEGKMNVETVGERNRTALMFACRHGQLHIAQYLVTEGANISALDVDRMNCLHLAAIGGHNDIMEWLLPFLDKNSLNAYERTPLMYAFKQGHHKTVEILLNAGAITDLQDKTGNSCIHFAAWSGDVSLVEQCLELKQSVNLKTHFGATPVMNASQNGDIAMIDFLLTKEANPRLTMRNLSNYACFGGHINVVKMLKDRQCFEISAIGSKGLTPFLSAIKSDQSEMVSYLLQTEPRLMGKIYTYGETALHIACMFGSVNTVAKLIEAGMNVNARDNNGNTPLTVSCRNKKVGVVNHLIEGGAKLTERDRYGNTCLHTAINARIPFSIPEKLLASGMDVNVRGSKGETPIMLACRISDKEYIDFLLSKGADIYKSDGNGANALHQACRNNKEDISIISKLVQYDSVGIDNPDRQGATPAMFAISKGRDKTLQSLLKKGARLTTVDDNGFSLLHIACRCKSADVNIIRMIINKGVDVNLPNRYGQTPVMLAAQVGRSDAIPIFIESGANLALVDDKGRKCTDYAREGGHLHVARLLHVSEYGQ